MSEITATIASTLNTLLEQKKFNVIKTVLSTMNPSDIAALLEDEPVQDLLILFRLLPKELAADTFVEMDSEVQKSIITGFSDMVIAQILLITPIIAGMMESCVSSVAPAVKETAGGMGLSGGKTLLLIMNESRYQIISTYLMGLSRALAEVGAVSMVGGAIAYKTNVMTTAIMNYTNMTDNQVILRMDLCERNGHKYGIFYYRRLHRLHSVR